jgi:hypothetical protein
MRRAKLGDRVDHGACRASAHAGIALRRVDMLGHCCGSKCTHPHIVVLPCTVPRFTARKVGQSRFKFLSPELTALIEALLFNFLAAPIFAIRAVSLSPLPWRARNSFAISRFRIPIFADRRLPPRPAPSMLSSQAAIAVSLSICNREPDEGPRLRHCALPRRGSIKLP